MGAHSRNKGSRLERVVCKLFADHFGGKWARAPLSGGWAGRAEFHTCGDVITTLPDFPFTIECKSVEGWHLEQLLVSPESCPITRWWRQAIHQAAEAGKQPLLVFTRNFQPVFAAVGSTEFFGPLPQAEMHTTLDGQVVSVFLLEPLLQATAPLTPADSHAGATG